MAHYRKIDVRIWNDERFLRLSDDGQLCFLMVLTHQHLTPFGALRSGVLGLAEFKGWLPERMAEAFREAFREGLLEGCEKPSLIYVPRYLKYNPPESPNCVKSWKKFLELLPDCDLKTRVISDVSEYVGTLSESYYQAFHDDAKASGKPSCKPSVKPSPKASGKPSLNQGTRNKEQGTNIYIPLYPPCLDTERFRAAWQKWEAYRREIKKTMSPTTQETALKQLEAFGPEIAEQAIVQSISNGWQGLFPEKICPPKNGTPARNGKHYEPVGRYVSEEDKFSEMVDRLTREGKILGRAEQ